MAVNTYLCITSSDERFTLKVEVRDAYEYGEALLTLAFADERRTVYVNDADIIFGPILNLTEVACLNIDLDGDAAEQLETVYGIKPNDVCELWDMYLEAKKLGIWEDDEGELPRFSDN